MKLHQSVTLVIGLLTMPLTNAAITSFSTGAGVWDIGLGSFSVLEGHIASSVWTYDTDPSLGIGVGYSLAGGGTATGAQFSGGTFGAVTTPSSPLNDTRFMQLVLMDNAIASADTSSDFLSVYSAAGYAPQSVTDLMVFESWYNDFRAVVVMAFQPEFLDEYIENWLLPTGTDLLSYSHFIYVTVEEHWDIDNNPTGFARLSANLNPVPLPPAVWLLGSALGGLLLRQRRQA